jgi:hypothetical protein
MSLDAMKQALEAFKLWSPALGHALNKRAEAVIALRAAIDQAEKQEPHSLLCVCGAEWDIYPDGKEVLASTAPRQWQGLTDEEIDELALDENGLPNSHIEFARAIEARLKEKNT